DTLDGLLPSAGPRFVANALAQWMRVQFPRQVELLIQPKERFLRARCLPTITPQPDPTKLRFQVSLARTHFDARGRAVARELDALLRMQQVEPGFDQQPQELLTALADRPLDARRCLWHVVTTEPAHDRVERRPRSSERIVGNLKVCFARHSEAPGCGCVAIPAYQEPH